MSTKEEIIAKMSTKEEIIAKMLLYFINYGLCVIAKNDDVFKEKIKNLDNIISWKIGKDIIFYTIVNNAEITGNIGDPPSEPGLIIEFKDPKKFIDAYLSFRGGNKIALTNLPEGSSISGDINIAASSLFMISYARQYLADLF